MSADSTHRFQPFQPSFELVENVDQPNQPKLFFFLVENGKTQPTEPNQPKTVDPNRTRPKYYFEEQTSVRNVDGQGIPSVNHTF